MAPMSEATYASPVLRTAYAVAPFSTHCTLNSAAIEAFAASLSSQPGDLPFPDPSSWASEPLHPIPALHTPQELVDWIFTVSLLNFSFWSELPSSERFGVDWRAASDGKPGHEAVVKHTGYWSLPAAISRALKDDGIPITSPSYWLTATDVELEHVFRASESSKEGIPLLDDRIRLLREAGAILCENYSGSFLHFIEDAAKAHADAHPSPSVAENGTACDALSLVKAVVSAFPQFRDDHVHPAVGTVHLWKRPQILVAELWAAFSSVSHDPAFPQITGIENLTMFADYRVPQILHSLHLLDYSPHLLSLLASHTPLASGSELEISLRSLSIVCVEELRAALVRRLRDAGRDQEAQRVNAVTLDFWLWNEAKRREKAGEGQHVECHRTRGIWY